MSIIHRDGWTYKAIIIPLILILVLFVSFWIARYGVGEYIPDEHPSVVMSNYFMIGVVNTADDNLLKEFSDFFSTNQIGYFLEGSLIYGMYVHEKDLPRVKAILETNQPPYSGFHSIWSKDYPFERTRSFR